MTNQNVTIEIQDFEDKKSQAGKRYTRFKTDQGWMSAFDDDVIKSCKEAEKKLVDVEIAIDAEKGFKNIRRFIGVSKEQNLANIEVVKVGAPAPIAPRNDLTMYVSYAKDLIVAGKSYVEAIKIVKDLKEALK